MKLDVKKPHFQENDFEIYEPNFWDFWEKINFETFYAQNYSQKVCSRSILNVQYVSKVYFTRRMLLVTLLTSFYRYNAFGCVYILLTLKNEKQKISLHQFLYSGDMFSNGISLDFCRNITTGADGHHGLIGRKPGALRLFRAAFWNI